MQNRSLIALIALLSLSLGWNLGQRRSEPVPVRQELLREMRANQQFLDECMANMVNQFTPGYRSCAIFSRLEDGRSRLNCSQGEVFKTGCPTEMALNGQGFFVLEKAGETFYTRDGRFSFREGKLSSLSGCVLKGYAVRTTGERVNQELQTITLGMDPMTKLYGGRYTGFHLDDAGMLYGEATMTDPVTGQQTTTNTPLFQVAVATFVRPENLKRGLEPTLFTATRESGQPQWSWAGQPGSGMLCPGSLELSNVDFIEQAHVIQALKTYAGLLYDGANHATSSFAMAKFQSELHKPMMNPAPMNPALPTSIGILGNGGKLPNLMSR